MRSIVRHGFSAQCSDAILSCWFFFLRAATCQCMPSSQAPAADRKASVNKTRVAIRAVDSSVIKAVSRIQCKRRSYTNNSGLNLLVPVTSFVALSSVHVPEKKVYAEALTNPATRYTKVFCGTHARRNWGHHGI